MNADERSLSCKTDCGKAVGTVCATSRTEYTQETVGECTVSYVYELGNTVPNYDQCYAAFAYINDAGKPGPDGCGGTLGGALGWDDKGNRTSDPIYAIQPKSGNPNCFKPPGDPASAPLAPDELPGGTRLPLETCARSVSRRANTACTIGSASYTASCTAVCMAWVASASAWW